MSRVVVYARTSGDEASTGQDVNAQAEAVKVSARALGHEVAGVVLEDGVSGSMPPMSRKTFPEAVKSVKQGWAEGIVMAEVSRFTRQHPTNAMVEWDALAEDGVPVLSLAESHFDTLTHGTDAEEDTAAVLMRFVTLWANWNERETIIRRVRTTMTELKSGRRATKSGKPVGRPKKVSDEEVQRAYKVACKHGIAEAARRLSKERGADEALDPKTVRKRKVGHSTLSNAFDRLGLKWPPEGGA